MRLKETITRIDAKTFEQYLHQQNRMVSIMTVDDFSVLMSSTSQLLVCSLKTMTACDLTINIL